MGVILGTLEFREPLMLLLALGAGPVFLLSRRAPGRVVFSSLDLLPAAGGGWRIRFAWVPDLLVALGVVGFALALAGPRTGEGFARVEREGIAIVMVVDTSGSMSALDLSTAERERNRLAAVQDVFEQFVLGGGDLPGARTTPSGWSASPPTRTPPPPSPSTTGTPPRAPATSN